MDNQRINDLAEQHWPDFLAVVVAALLLRLGFQIWSVLVPGTGLLGLMPVLYVYAAAIGLFLIAVTDVDLREHGTLVAMLVLGAVIIGMVGVFLALPSGRFETDAILFSRYSVDLLLSGQNPYAHSMAPATEIYGAETHLTPRLDGSGVDSLSYPAGAVLAFAPQAVLEVGQADLGLTLAIPTVAMFALLIRDSPPVVAVLPFSLFATKNYVWAGFGGLLDPLWVLPVLVAMRFWYQERYVVGAAFVGIACAMKQHPWFILPFLAYWLYAESGSYRGFARLGGRAGGAVLAGFLVPNLPFIVWDPAAWVDGVLTPISGAVPLVHQGVGLTLLTVTGTYALPTSFYSVLLGLAGIVALVAYVLFFDRLKWVAWITPAILLFLPHRSLNSYFAYVVPIALYATYCHLSVLRLHGPTIPSLPEVNFDADTA